MIAVILGIAVGLALGFAPAAGPRTAHMTVGRPTLTYDGRGEAAGEDLEA